MENIVIETEISCGMENIVIETEILMLTQKCHNVLQIIKKKKIGKVVVM